MKICIMLFNLLIENIIRIDSDEDGQLESVNGKYKVNRNLLKLY